MKRHYYFTILCAAALLFSQNLIAQGSEKAYDFTSNYIDIPDDPSLNSPTITLEAWIKADSWAGNIWQNVIISKDGWATGDQGYTLRAGANGSLSFNFGDGSWHEVASGPLMSTGKWYHVAGTYDGAVMRLYINGEEVNSVAYASAISATNYNVNIGKIVYTAGGTRYFDGMIDEVRIWNVALPQSSIKEYMCKQMSITHPQYLNIAGHWNMDATGTVVDQSPNGNDGTSIGATHVNSGAAIGDESIYVYGAAPNLTLANGTTDSVTVTSTDVFNTVHVYRVNGAPSNGATTLDSIDDSQYYGVYAAKTGSFSYTTKYEYGAGNAFFSGVQNYGVLGTRTNGNAANWTASTATHDIPNSSMTANFTTTRELRLATNCPDINLSPSSPQSFCQGDSVTLTDNGSATIRQWHDASGPMAGVTGNAITTSISGTYYLVANDAGCMDTSQMVTVTVNPIPVADFGTIDTSYCDTDQNYTITNGFPAGGSYSGSGVLGNVFKPTMTGIGTFTLIYDVTDMNGCSDSDTISVSVYDTPTAPVITQNGADLCVTMVAGMTYAWYENGTLISGATSNCYTAMNNGNYTCELIGDGGCAAESSIYNLNDLGLEGNLLDGSISVMPNPTKDWITISSNNNSVEFEIKVIDEQGRVIMNSEKAAATFKINLGQYEKGVYFIHLIGENNQSIRKVVLK